MKLHSHTKLHEICHKKDNSCPLDSWDIYSCNMWQETLATLWQSLVQEEWLSITSESVCSACPGKVWDSWLTSLAWPKQCWLGLKTPNQTKFSFLLKIKKLMISLSLQYIVTFLTKKARKKKSEKKNDLIGTEAKIKWLCVGKGKSLISLYRL